MPKTTAIVKITTNKMNKAAKLIYNHSFNKLLLVTLKHEYLQIKTDLTVLLVSFIKEIIY